jgi:hypothetical protein
LSKVSRRHPPACLEAETVENPPILRRAPERYAAGRTPRRIAGTDPACDARFREQGAGSNLTAKIWLSYSK